MVKCDTSYPKTLQCSDGVDLPLSGKCNGICDVILHHEPDQVNAMQSVHYSWGAAHEQAAAAAAACQQR